MDGLDFYNCIKVKKKMRTSVTDSEKNHVLDGGRREEGGNWNLSVYLEGHIGKWWQENNARNGFVEDRDLKE